ncbi:MAG: hypothetical protein VST68_04620 [Nitrospirota bacterium]|nr:hypothetical protein [Nitrospirota bacterium]
MPHGLQHMLRTVPERDPNPLLLRSLMARSVIASNATDGWLFKWSISP